MKNTDNDTIMAIFYKIERLFHKWVSYIIQLPSVVMLQNANIGISSLMEDSQYLPLVASFSLILISLQDSAASSGMEPSGTKQDQIRLEIDDALWSETNWLTILKLPRLTLFPK